MDIKEYTLMIVDDMPDNIQVIVDYLKDAGLQYKILKAPNGEVAYKIALKKTPDIIITDWEMPVLDGIGLIRKLRSNPEMKDVPVIMCTGIMTSSGNLKTALEAGASDYIRKPVDKLELIARTTSMLKLAVKTQTLKVRNQELKERNERIAELYMQSESLLLNILPGKVAQELREKGRVTPLKYDSVSIIFADFTQFTRIASEMPTEQLVKELDHCFHAFDTIVKTVGLEKIKTIGDAYMAAGGIPEPNSDHPRHAVTAAQKMIEFMDEWGKEKESRGEEPWKVRIGIHTGPVVAGVVGLHKFAYDIWGDAVNRASRMETASEPMKINISQSTYDFVKNEYPCEYRGKIEVKNIGPVDMYFVTG